MKILALDTSSKICSVSILEDTNIIIEKHSDDEKTHSQKLMPLVDKLFKESNIQLKDINLLSCCIGPRLFYRSSNWIGNSQRIGTGVRKATHSCGYLNGVSL